MKWYHMVTVLLALVLGRVAGSAEALLVSDVWIHEPLPGGLAVAGYMKLDNPGQQERILVGAESPLFERVVLHRTEIEQGVSRMVHQHMVMIPANEMVLFSPRGLHLMLLEPRRRVSSGERFAITLFFKDGTSQQIECEVRPRQRMGTEEGKSGD